MGIFALAVVGLLLLCAVFADFIATRDPIEQFRRFELLTPFSAGPDGRPFLLGTDALGRDLFSRVIHGTRISIYVSVASTLAVVMVGTAAGLVAGYFGGWVDVTMQRLVEIFMSMPGILLAMVIASTLNAGLNGVVIAVLVTGWPRIARVVRGDVLVVRELSFVEAARSIGCPARTIVLRHVLPNVSSSIIVLGTLSLGAAVLIEAGLSFFSIGASPPTPSWGLMISEARRYVVTSPHLLLVPAAALSLVVLALNLGGDALRDQLDPRLRNIR